MADYLLYGGGVTQSASVEALLRELGLSYRLQVVDIAKGEHRQPAYLAVNPAGFLPALRTPSGEILHENLAIMFYLAESFPQAELAPLSGDPLRGRFLSRVLFLNNEIQSRTKSFDYPERWSIDPADAPRIRDKAFEVLMERWALYDRWLGEDGPYALGKKFSLADIHMTLWASYGLKETDDILCSCAAVARCHAAVLKRPLSGPVFARLRKALDAWNASGE